jgi:hypothetical protein
MEVQLLDSVLVTYRVPYKLLPHTEILALFRLFSSHRPGSASNKSDVRFPSVIMAPRMAYWDTPQLVKNSIESFIIVFVLLVFSRCLLFVVAQHLLFDKKSRSYHPPQSKMNRHSH